MYPRRLPRPGRQAEVLRFPIVIICVVVLFSLSTVFLFVARSQTAPEEGDSPMESETIDLSKPNQIFLDSILPYVSPAFKDLFGLPDQFLADLRDAVAKAPINEATGNQQIMITISSVNHLTLCHNLLCSSRAAGVPENFHLFIAADLQTYKAMKAAIPNMLFMDISDRDYMYEEFCKIKLFIQYQLLLWGVETTICDDDLVIIKNPMPLFVSDAHFCVGTEGILFEFDGDYDFGQFNVGFMRVIPTRVSILLYAKWLSEAVPNHEIIDQEVLQNMLRPLRYRNMNQGPVQKYAVESLTGGRTRLFVRFFDPLDVTHGGHIHLNAETTAGVARRRGKTEPYVVHLAWISQENKIPVMEEHDLMFVDEERSECATRPKGAGFSVWR